MTRIRWSVEGRREAARRARRLQAVFRVIILALLAVACAGWIGLYLFFR
jgi:hypothetical protein